ncbi:MAG TPA: UvrD-helicase domain-containing protein, partial [Alphaproteobacteria bacterium]|nr:UvrD-helicase domain-containing protein [Alphaproteobacteria bacterium]
MSRDLFLLANDVLTEYEALKTARGALDFDDLILRTLALLNGSQYPDLRETMPGWVNYKLDQGLDHLLVDEAQDTNPEQWKILEALTREFFGGDGSRAPDAAPRTVFVVGDDKQSIYSFQRASPQEFGRMKAFFDEKHKTVGRKLDDVQLNISFRSAESVLKAVDAAFADMGVEHRWHRRGQAGLVELWPLTQTAKREKTDFWELPLHEVSDETAPSGPAQMASRIAATIGHWLNAGEILPSRGRAIRPGDIMILLKNRKKGEPIVAALKAAGIPVAGADRMVLNEELAVQDLLAACGFALLPEDDLTLACLLKSPLIGMDEEALFTLAYGRRASLWAAIPPGNLKDYLQTLIGAARAQGPYAFLSTLLNRPCPASARSGLAAMQARLGLHALEPIEALLEAALEFERSSPASLQLFVDWQSRQAREIKREMEAADDESDQGAVRIMTVHGSKGLQAPIVFLPDTVRTAKSSPNQSARRLLWPHQSGNTLPLWSPRKDTDSSLFEQGMDHLESLEDAEYRRLFYVAMTRAEDRLYIAGAAGTKNPIEESWYNYA